MDKVDEFYREGHWNILFSLLKIQWVRFKQTEKQC